MNKWVRVILYVSSLLLLVLVIGAIGKAVIDKRNGQSEATEPASETVTERVVLEVGTETGAQVTNVSEKPKDDEPQLEESESQGNHAGTTLVFTGDILIGNSVSANYAAAGIDAILSEEMQHTLRDADITMVNEEFPFGTTGTAMEDKQYTFRVNPSYVSAFTDMGVDIVSLANNHILDYGAEALEETFACLDEAGIRYAGAGANKQRAQELQTIEIKGRSYGFLAASRVIPVASWNIENSAPGVFATYDSAALVAAIEKAEQACDFVTVFVHWGLENKEYPEDYERTLAQQYIAAGADLVIGSHSHCLQGVEYIDGKPVFYSLGNFLFGQDGNTAAVKVTVDDEGQAEYAFVAAKETGAYTDRLTGEAGSELYRYLDGISYNAQIDEDGKISQE